MKKYGPSIRLKLRCEQRACRVIADPLKPSKSLNRNIKINRKRRRDSSSERIDYLEPPRHCYGPSCTKQSRPGSKYCSEECGIKLATSRIFQVLPQRLQEWGLSPCIAEQNNGSALENVRRQKDEVRRILQELDKRHAELDKIVERARHAVIDPKADIDENDDTEMNMYCITCGHEINSRTAIKHMEKCFNKVHNALIIEITEKSITFSIHLSFFSMNLKHHLAPYLKRGLKDRICFVTSTIQSMVPTAKD